MTRPLVRLVIALAAVFGALLGMTATLVLTSPDDRVLAEVVAAHGVTAHDVTAHDAAGHDVTGHDVTAHDAGHTGADHAATPTPPASVPAPADAERILLMWTAGGLPAGVAEAAADDPAIRAWSVVAGDQAGLVAVHGAGGEAVLSVAAGWHVPLDVLAIDPAAHAPFVATLGTAGDQEAVATLAPGEALLSTTSSALRGVGVDGVLTLTDGSSVRIAGVIDDRAASGAELVVHTADAARLGVDTVRFLLLAHTGSRAEVQHRLVAEVGSIPVRFRTPAETTWLRHGDAVLPQVLLKQAFGEFAIRLVDGRDVEVAASWEAAHIVDEEVEILGQVRCHRMLLPRLAGAMAELSRRNLTHLVDVDAFAGCYVPRRIAPGEPLSRHAWGVALDINVGDNPRGSFSTQDPRLVEVMRAHGFTWGGTWLVPDPAHYEIVATGEW